ncbi:peptide ABC transporter permease [Chitinimonas prasina]|uniref:Peptide ABC transporter permease n=1 Tax=Chitinimonas prasina TaxID=1434937 RepID=A0ABQ5YG02_9NEIS|nr:ABC transporter permease [Chitinimonas prasina]GLR13926.1 peptide ABC transporter permease [Chitinimonas prasina]
MMTYLVRRTLYSILVLAGINLVTFFLFFSVNTPDDMARLQLGGKRVAQEAVERWKAERGYDQPLYFNAQAAGVGKLTQTVFFESSAKLLRLDFGKTNENRNIGWELGNRIGPTLALAIPILLISVTLSIILGLGLVFYRHTVLDTWGVVVLVGLMSTSSLFFIIMGQYLFAKLMVITPVSGFSPPPGMFKFLLLPVLVSVIAHLGPDTRLYRTLFLEELGKDYVRTARAKGVSEWAVLGRHVLRNSLIPIITSIGLLLPALLAGSILLETFFGIPGLGTFAVDGITSQDFSIVRAMVFFGSFLYVITYLLTDFAYAWSDPRVRLK